MTLLREEASICRSFGSQIFVWGFCLVLCLAALGCSKKNRRHPIPGKRQLITRIQGCGADMVQAYEARLTRILKQPGAGAGARPRPRAASLTAPTDQARLRGLAIWLLRRLLKRLRRIRSEKAFGILIRRGALKPLRACYASKRCAAFASCTVRHHPGTHLERTEIVHVLTTGTLPPGAAGGHSVAIVTPRVPPGPKPVMPEAPVLTARVTAPEPSPPPSLVKADLSKRDPALDHRPNRPRRGPPPVWVVRHQHLTLLEPAGRALKQRARVDLSILSGSRSGGAVKLLRGPNGTVLIHTGQVLGLLDRSDGVRRVWVPKPGRRIAAVALYGDRVLVAAEGSLIVLDSRFQEMGRIHLGLRNKNKEAHHILVHGDEALLLDNMVIPILLFRVDLADPSKPRILRRIRERGIGVHLTHQWVDAKAKRWAVVAKTGGRGGNHQSVLLMGSQKPTGPQKILPRPTHNDPRFFAFLPSRAAGPEVLATALLYRWSRGRYTPPSGGKPARWGKVTETGHKLLRGSSQAPHWAVVVKPDRKRKRILLGQLRVKNNKIRVTHSVELTQKHCYGRPHLRGRRPARRPVQRCRQRTRVNARLDHRHRWIVVALGRWLIWLKSTPGRKPRVAHQYERRVWAPRSVLLAP